jgi:hypothetical protein
MNIEKYNKLHDELMKRLESGEITTEQAKEVNDLAFDKYITESPTAQTKDISLKIWGKSLTLKIEFDIYKGEEVTSTQENARDLFLKNAEKLINDCKTDVEKYCLKQNKNDINDDIDNILKYVKPKSIFIKRTENNDRVVAVLCSYKFNPDDGIAIIFKNENFLKIGTENIIL